MTHLSRGTVRAVAAAALAATLAGCAVFRDADLAPLSDLKVLDAPDVVVVARDGRSMPIVAGGGRRSVDAAFQLAAVIWQATGVKPTIVREFPGAVATNAPALFVGATAAASGAGLSAPDDSPEAFRVVVEGGSVYFLGREDFAVLDWSERQLGARCYGLDPEGSEISVPRVPEIRATAVDYSDRPVYGKRVMGFLGSRRWAKFCKVGNVHRGGVCVHAPQGWYMDAALVAERPEIFALTPDGRRATSPLLCYGNPATLEYYEHRIDEAIAGVRDSGGIVDVRRKVITVSPWDVAYDCTCGFCRPLYDELLGEYGAASPIVWGRFLKGLARWARERHPDYVVSFLPYWNMCEVPPGLDLRDEGNCEAEVCIMPGLALLKDDSLRARQEDLVRRWTEVTGRKAILWHYTCWPAEFTSAPSLFGETLRRHWRDMRGVVDGCFVCGGGEAPRLSLMYYVCMRCMWNPDIDVEAVYDVFAERMFGPAARPMRRLVSLQERGWSRPWSVSAEWPSDDDVFGVSYPPEVVREMKGLLAEAERLAAPDADALRHVRRYASGFDDFFFDADIVQRGVPKPAFEMVRAESAPVVDGLLDDACWEKAPVRSFVKAMDRADPEPKHATEMRGVWLEDGLVFGFRFEEPAVGALPTGVGMDDIERQDHVDVYLADATTQTGAAWRVRFDCDGRLGLWEGAFPRPSGDLRVALHKADGHWNAELFVPNSALGGLHASLCGNVVRWRVGDASLCAMKAPSESFAELTRLSTGFSKRNSDRNAFVPFLAVPPPR